MFLMLRKTLTLFNHKGERSVSNQNIPRKSSIKEKHSDWKIDAISVL